MAFSYQGLSGLVERPDYDSGFQSLDAFVDGTIGGFDTAAATLTAVGVAAVVPIDAQSVQYAELIGQDTLATRQYLSLLGIRDVYYPDLSASSIVIPLGIGTPSSISALILVGLAPAGTAVTGTGAVTTAAAALAATGTLEFVGTGSLTTAASQLDISAILAYNGTASYGSAAASLSGAGTLSSDAITGTAAMTSAAASLRAKGRRRKGGGHSVVDLARYDAFVSHGETLLEELGQAPQPTGATPVELSVFPTQPTLPTPELRVPTAQTVELPELPAIKGKRWIKGHASVSGQASLLLGTAQLVQTGTAWLWVPQGSTLAATGHVDNFYTIRQRDERALEEFLLTRLLS
jgi:hypothetical protein